MGLGAGFTLAYLAFLDAQPQTNKSKKAGVQGYCMGGPMAFRTSAAVPNRVGAVASFHGGGLVRDMPSSPHLQAAATKAQFLVAIAENDDANRGDLRTELNPAPAEPIPERRLPKTLPSPLAPSPASRAAGWIRP